MAAVNKAQFTVFVAGCLLATTGLADGDIGGFVELSTAYSDNANKNRTNELSERQDELTLGIDGNYEFNIAKLELDYEVSRGNYDKDSQDDRTLWRGDAGLAIGSKEDTFDLELGHSRRTLLAEARLVDVLDNLEERNISFARPTARVDVTPVDTLSISGIFTDVSYRFDDVRDTERYGGDLRWQHRLSKISGFEVSVQQIEVNYPDLDQGDYDYRLAWIGYESSQRKLGYRIELGYNETEPDVGEEADGIFVNAFLSYGDESNNLQLNASRDITDTSAGNGNDSYFAGAGAGDSVLDIQDEIERTSLDLTWNYALLCTRCNLELSVGVEIEDYNDANVADNTEAFLSGRLDYRVSGQSLLKARARYRDQDFDDASLEPFSRYDVDVEYVYNFTEELSGAVFFAYEERTSDLATLEYEEFLFGVRAVYAF